MKDVEGAGVGSVGGRGADGDRGAPESAARQACSRGAVEAGGQPRAHKPEVLTGGGRGVPVHVAGPPS